MKRYQVFVSSTFVDLQPERLAVLNALQRMGCFAAGMELFPSAGKDQFEYIKKVIDQSDYYVLILAGRYGSLADGQPDEGKPKSYTEMEFDYAYRQGIPILPFLHMDPREIPDKYCESDSGMRAMLQDFRKKVMDHMLVNFFKSSEDLAMKVTSSLHHAIGNDPRPGWIRAGAMSVTEEAGDRLGAPNPESPLPEKQTHEPTPAAGEENGEKEPETAKHNELAQDEPLHLVSYEDINGNRYAVVSDEEFQQLLNEFADNLNRSSYYYDAPYTEAYAMAEEHYGSLRELDALKRYWDGDAVEDMRTKEYLRFLSGLTKHILAYLKTQGRIYGRASNIADYLDRQYQRIKNNRCLDRVDGSETFIRYFEEAYEALICFLGDGEPH